MRRADDAILPRQPRTLLYAVQQEARRPVEARALEAAVLELYRLGRWTSGRAARALGLSRTGFLLLAGRRQVATLQLTPAELKDELAEL